VDRFAVGTSNYNSMQVALDRALGKNIQFRTAYTYSKCLDYGSYYTGNDSIGPNGQTAGLQAGNLANTRRNVDYGPCDFDLRHNWTSNLIWQLPFEGNRLKQGWQLSLITSVHSGTPYSVYDAIDRADVGAGGAASNAERPDLVPGANSNPTGVRQTPLGVFGFDPSAFQPQPLGVFGNLGRNTLVASGVREVDFSLSKNTKITERTNAQLRLDIFNLANHTNFGFPNAALYSGQDALGNVRANPTAGQITSTATTSRQIQLSAKFVFKRSQCFGCTRKVWTRPWNQIRWPREPVKHSKQPWRSSNLCWAHGPLRPLRNANTTVMAIRTMRRPGLILCASRAAHRKSAKS
jgi:hypothetical protein